MQLAAAQTRQTDDSAGSGFSRPSRKSAALALLLIVLVGWAFLPALHNGFVNFDDEEYVVGNAHVKAGLTWDGVRWAFTSTAAGNWHPLTWLSHMLDCELFGLNPWGHHLTSLMLHAANALLVFFVFSRMTGAIWRSFFVAAIFAVHPLRVESVAWASERKDVLSLLFWMLTLWSYFRYAIESKVQGPKSKVQGLLRTYTALLCPGSVVEADGGHTAVCAVAARFLAAPENCGVVLTDGHHAECGVF